MQRKSKTQQQSNVPTRQVKQELQQNEALLTSSTQYSVTQYIRSTHGISPVKTHRAKVTYEPKSQKKKNISKETQESIEAESTKSTTHEIYKKDPLQIEFKRKKDEREKEVKEIQNMLEEIKKPLIVLRSDINEYTKKDNSIPLPKNHIQIRDQNQAPVDSSSHRRSKTMLQIEKNDQPMITRRDSCSGSARLRSKSTPRSDIVIAETKKNVQNVKRRSTNAIQYMQKDRNKTAREKEEIKKRLEDLRKNTRLILQKNKSKTTNNPAENKAKGSDSKELKEQKMQNKNTEAQDHAHQIIDKTMDKKELEKDCANSAKSSMAQLSANELQNKFRNIEKKDSEENSSRTSASSKLHLSTSGKNHIQNELTNMENCEKDNKIIVDSQSQKSDKSINSKYIPLVENSKRIGLLRKPETNDHSYSAIKEFSFDKENVAREMLTPKVAVVHESHLGIASAKSLCDKEPVPSNVFIVEQVPTEEHNVNKKKCSVVSETDLEVPTSRLNYSTKLCHTNKQLEDNRNIAKQKPLYDEEPVQSTEFIAKQVPTEENGVNIKKSSVVNETNLEVPLSRLSCSSKQCYSNKQLEDNRNVKPVKETEIKQKECSELPFWLKPSSVQIYPYNFIMAVRKKLEAIAYPTTAISQSQSSNKNKITSTFGSGVKKTNLSEIQKNPAPHNAKRRLLSASSTEGQTKSAENNVKSEKLVGEAKPSTNITFNPTKSLTLTDFESNFSSISMQLPTSNTASEVSSLRTESIIYKQRGTPAENGYIQNKTENDDDDEITTVSSTIFGSPEKKMDSKYDFKFLEPRPVSPLSVERIEHLKIRPKSQLYKSKKRYQFDAIHRNEPGDLQLKQASLADENSLNVEINLNQLLEDFNRSLSQVIQVNEQLKSTLDKSHLIFSPERSDRHTAPTTKEYTTDFESSSSSKHYKSSTDAHKQIYSGTNTIVTPPKSRTKGNTRHSSPNFELDLNSITSCISTATKTFSLEIGQNDEIEDNFAEGNRELAETTYRLNTQNSIESEKSISPAKSNQSNVKTIGHISGINTLFNTAVGDQSQCSVRQIETKNQKPKAYTSPFDNTTIIQKISPEKFDSKQSSIKCNTEIRSLQSTALSSRTYTNDRKHATNEYSNTGKNLTSKNNSEEFQNFNELSNNENDTTFRLKKHASIIETNINNTRGDYPQTERNALNESEFYAAKNNEYKIDYVQSDVGSTNGSNNNNSTLKTPLACNDISANSTHKTIDTKYNTQTIHSTNKSRNSNGSEIIAIFNQSDIEVSVVSSCKSSISETSVNYSCIGLFEKLIKNETTKSEYLTALLKTREKALLDRTRGQLAWLEVQKQRYRAKGLLLQITAIKKKQRGILLKMEKEREEIKRLLESTTTNSSAQSTGLKNLNNTATKRRTPKTAATTTANSNSPAPTILKIPLLPLTKSVRSSHRKQQDTNTLAAARSAPIIRADYALESCSTLEELLIRRERDLRNRRAHVERLMQWHQKLDQEEAEVLQMERMLLDSNNANVIADRRQKTELALSIPHQNSFNINPRSSDTSQRSTKMERRLKEIDKSLQELQNITSTTNVASNKEDNTSTMIPDGTKDYVRTTGSKLNKLWRRLTSQQIEKFEPNCRYKLCKSDLERLYEEAKSTVLREYSQYDESTHAAELLERCSISKINRSSSKSNHSHHSRSSSQLAKMPYVPELNLSVSSTQSECQTVSLADQSNASQGHNGAQHKGIYSPSVAENNFQMISESHSMKMDNDDDVDVDVDVALSESASIASSVELSARIERNVEKFLLQKHNLSSENNGLQRSFSDTQINVNQNHQTFGKHHAATKFSSQSLSSSVQPINSADTPNSLKSMETQTTATTDASNNSGSSKGPVPESEHSSIRSTTTEISTNAEAESSEANNESAVIHSQTRQSVICSVGKVCQSRHTNSTSNSDSANVNKTKSAETNLQSKMHEANVSLLTSPAQISAVSESKEREIAEKLDKISAAVLNMSRTKTNSLPTYESTKTIPPPDAPIATPNISADVLTFEKESSNQSSDVSSYSYNFDLNSPSGLTIKSDSPDANINSLQISPIPTSISQASLSINSLKSSNCKTATQSIEQNQKSLLDNYEADFEIGSDETCIEDLSLPQFNSTLDTTQNLSELDENKSSSSSSCSITTRKTNSPISKDNLTQKNQPSVEILKQKKDSMPPTTPPSTPSPSPPPSPATPPLPTPSPPSTSPLSTATQSPPSTSPLSTATQSPPLPQSPPPISLSPTIPTSAEISTTTAAPTVSTAVSSLPQTNIQSPTSATTATIAASSVSNTHLMPDIINELEIRRCQQILMDNEQLKQYEHVTAVPYMFVREIPNKPPPPYVPPEHGSPMTTIFPSEERIKDITYRRTHELYCELTNTKYLSENGEMLPTVMSEKITNIYERIILDICREYLEEHNEILKQGDPTNFHKQLAFFNPPNRLHCIQESIYKEVRRCLAMDKTSPKRSQVYSIYGQRAKRDHIGKIIIQEMYDEDDKWCNFHREEHEVLDLIIEEMINQEINQITTDVYVEEGGIIDTTPDAAECEEVVGEDLKTEEMPAKEQQIEYTEVVEHNCHLPANDVNAVAETNLNEASPITTVS